MGRSSSPSEATGSLGASTGRSPAVSHRPGCDSSGIALEPVASCRSIRATADPSKTVNRRLVPAVPVALDALEGPPLTDDELAAIDADAVEAGINLWAGVTED